MLTAALLLSLVPAPVWVWPLEPEPAVSRPFTDPERFGAGHYGVDLRADPGQPVRAAGAGTVTYAGLLAGRGVVVVSHGELRTTYEPVDAVVSRGAVVQVGQVVGTVGSGHASCGAGTCLHWGLRRGEAYLDPLSLLGAGPVRLLPLDGRSPRAGVPTGAPRDGSTSVAPRDGSTSVAPSVSPPAMEPSGAPRSGMKAGVVAVAGPAWPGAARASVFAAEAGAAVVAALAGPGAAGISR